MEAAAPDHAGEEPDFQDRILPLDRRARRQGKRAARGRRQEAPPDGRDLLHDHTDDPARLAPLPPGIPRRLRHPAGAVRQGHYEAARPFGKLHQKRHQPGDRERPGCLLHRLQHARPPAREEQVPAAGTLPFVRQRAVQPDIPERPRDQRAGPPAPGRLRLRPVLKKPV